MLNRRSFLTGLIAAPVIVRYASLMPVKAIETYTPFEGEMWWNVEEGSMRVFEHGAWRELEYDYTKSPFEGFQKWNGLMLGDTPIFFDKQEKSPWHGA